MQTVAPGKLAVFGEVVRKAVVCFVHVSRMPFTERLKCPLRRLRRIRCKSVARANS